MYVHYNAKDNIVVCVSFYNPLLYLLLGGGEDVGITSIDDGKDGAVVELTASSAKVGVVTRVVVDSGLGKHGEVLDLGLAEGRAVIADDDELGLAGTQSLESRLVPQGVLAGLHHERQARVDGLGRCLSFLGHCW